MSVRTVVAVTALVVLAGAGAAAPVGALGLAGPPAQSGTGGNTSNATLGASVSAFMQASAAETEGTVENGMFAAEFNRTADEQSKERLVTSRTEILEDRLDRLREERAALLTNNGTLTVSERAKAARLAARIEALQRAINQTETAANRASVPAPRLDELRKNASELAGPEMTVLAGGIVGNGDRGPPTERGRMGNGTGPPEHADDCPPFDESENETETDESENETETDESENETEIRNGCRGADGNDSNNSTETRNGSNDSDKEGNNSNNSSERRNNSNDSSERRNNSNDSSERRNGSNDSSERRNGSNDSSERRNNSNDSSERRNNSNDSSERRNGSNDSPERRNNSNDSSERQPSSNNSTEGRNSTNSSTRGGQ